RRPGRAVAAGEGDVDDHAALVAFVNQVLQAVEVRLPGRAGGAVDRRDVVLECRPRRPHAHPVEAVTLQPVQVAAERLVSGAQARVVATAEEERGFAVEREARALDAQLSRRRGGAAGQQYQQAQDAHPRDDKTPGRSSVGPTPDFDELRRDASPGAALVVAATAGAASLAPA